MNDNRANVGLILDPVFEVHDTGPGHPERPERLASIRKELDARGLIDRCRLLPPESATDELLLRVHDTQHIQRVHQAVDRGETMVDSMDTPICPESERVARLAAGSAVALCREVADGRLDRGLLVARPPGHHAERDLAMGFCLFNNVAVAAADLRAVRGVERVLIVDWDVHHGNGTQHLFEADPDVFFFSLHQWPLYPGTGARNERGREAGEGATLNCPLPPGSGDEAFLAALRDELVPAAEEFQPEFVLISAGFDAHAADPLGDLEVSTPAYAEATRIVLEISGRYAGGRVVSLLEGGYDLTALADSAATHLKALLETA